MAPHGAACCEQSRIGVQFIAVQLSCWETVLCSRNLRMPLTPLNHSYNSLDLLESFWRDALWHGAAWRRAA